MQRRKLLQLLAASAAAPLVRAANAELVVAVNQTTIESAPFFIQSIPGIRVVPVANGRAASAMLVSGMADAATGSETQALLNSIAQPDLRIVLTLAECRYRMVARKSAGIQGIIDLRGKRVAQTPGTSSIYFLVDMLRMAGLTTADVQLVTMEGPDMPAALASKQIDAMAMWEPHAQNALDLLGADHMILTHPNAYFERFNLNTTANVLKQPERRAVLVAAITAIAEVSRQLEKSPAPFLPALSQAINTPVKTIENVWSQFRFPARLDQTSMLEILGKMEPWAAEVAQRNIRPPQVLAPLVDASIVKEAGL
jgi:sulfonate transport system substrate-binding protein